MTHSIGPDAKLISKAEEYRLAQKHSAHQYIDQAGNVSKVAMKAGANTCLGKLVGPVAGESVHSYVDNSIDSSVDTTSNVAKSAIDKSIDYSIDNNYSACVIV